MAEKLPKADEPAVNKHDCGSSRTMTVAEELIQKNYATIHSRYRRLQRRCREPLAVLIADIRSATGAPIARSYYQRIGGDEQFNAQLSRSPVPGAVDFTMIIADPKLIVHLVGEHLGDGDLVLTIPEEATDACQSEDATALAGIRAFMNPSPGHFAVQAIAADSIAVAWLDEDIRYTLDEMLDLPLTEDQQGFLGYMSRQLSRNEIHMSYPVRVDGGRPDATCDRISIATTHRMFEELRRAKLRRHSRAQDGV